MENIKQCSPRRDLFISRRKGKISNKTHKQRIRWSSRPKSGYMSRLCKGKVLAPLIFNVLDGNHLVRVCVCSSGSVIVCNLLLINLERRKK